MRTRCATTTSQETAAMRARPRRATSKPGASTGHLRGTGTGRAPASGAGLLAGAAPEDSTGGAAEEIDRAAHETDAMGLVTGDNKN
jgi:hypothetical protein